MKLFKSSWALGALLALAASAAMAQDSHVAYINVQRITSESAPAKAATAKLESEFSKRQKDLAEMQSNLRSFTEKFDRDAPTMTDSQRAAKQKEFNDMGREFQRKKREFDEDLSSRQSEELRQVLDKATKAVRQIAETEKYDLVIQEQVVYFNPKVDITDKVISILNAAAPAK